MRKTVLVLRALTLSVVVFSNSGCRNSVPLPWKVEEGNCGGVACSDPVSAFVTASEFCRKVHNYYEAGGTVAGYGKASIGIVGAVAGSVIAPVTQGTSTKAWAGLAGSTNAMQTYMDEALSTSLALKRQAAIAAAMTKGHEAIGRAVTPQDKVLAAMGMTNGCWLAGSETDQATLSAIIAVPLTTASAPSPAASAPIGR